MSIKQILRPCYYVPLIGIILLTLSPIIVEKPLFLHIIIMVVFYATLGSAWNIVGGYAGLLSLGHTAFFGIGAYTSTVLYSQFGISPWCGILLGSFLSMMVSAIVGYPSLRLKGPFFALSTIAFAEVLHIIAVNWRKVTEGSVGICIQFQPSFYNFIFTSKISYAYISIGLLFFVLAVTWVMGVSRFGYYLKALREEEDAAQALGINTARFKLLALIISAFFTSLGGTFYAQYFLFIDPYSVLSVDLSIQMALVTIIGGVGTVIGPVVGSFLMIPVGEFLRAGFGGGLEGLHFVIYGTILILVVIFIPHGLVQEFRKKYQSILSKLPDFEEKKTLPLRVADVFAISHTNQPKSKRREDLKSPILEVQMISKYFGGLAAISNVNLEIRPGEILGVIGPNGAGKTTLFNIISGFCKPNKGNIFYGKEKINGFAPHILCHMGIARTFQIARPFLNMSVLDNVRTGAFCKVRKPAIAKAQAEEVLRFVGLWSRRSLLASSLNLAEKKRLELAKALATQPKIVLLDEVMAGLNWSEASEVVDLIKKVSETGITVMVIEHMMFAVMSLCNRIVVIHHGEKITEGTPNEVVNNPKVIEAYLGEEYLVA